MAITYVGAASAAATTLTLPTHQAGDLLVMAAFTSGATIPTIPSGWIQKISISQSSRRLVVAWRTATAAGTSSGTWTNASVVAAAAYRSDASKYLGVGSAGVNDAFSSANIAYQACLNLHGTSAGTWVIAIAGTAVDYTANTAPSGMTNRTAIASTNEIGLHDTNGVVSTWSTTNVATTATAYAASTLEIYESDIALTGGGGVPLIGTGGLVY